MRLSADEFKTTYGFMKPSASGPPVIVYCRTGVRAERAGKLFIEQFGFTRFVLAYVCVSELSRQRFDCNAITVTVELSVGRS